ncbi:MAG: SH3 domain-containing protein [Spirochaetes bacterium]|nr:SH3 domain-containing protein [Spirochaetota bacterium]
MKQPLHCILCVTAALALATGCAGPPEGIVTSENGLVLRSAPSARSARIGFLPEGSVLTIRDSGGPRETIHGVSGNWLRVGHGGRDGWAFGGFVRPLKSKLAGAYRGDDRSIRFYEYENGDFEMTVNLCQGIGTMEGICSRRDDGLLCRVSKRDFSGFRGDGIGSFRLLRSGRSLRYRGEGIGCGPNGDELLRGI